MIITAPGIPGITISPTTLAPVIRGLPVIAPLAAAAGDSLLGHLPVGWFALLAACDILIAVLIIARRRRAGASL